MLTLIIDGNYFAQRLRNSMDLKFIDDPAKDKRELFQGAATSLASEIRGLSKVIDSVMICRDWSSWRKKIDQVYPLESKKDDDEQVYKANRDFDKDYDTKAFYGAYDDFCELCEKHLNIPVIKTRGAEADDGVYLMAAFNSMKGKGSICWTSDGDYIQLVNKDTYLLKFPKRELYLNKEFNKPKSKTKTMDDVFGNRALDSGVILTESFDEKTTKLVNPYTSLFIKVTQGDGKDNVPPLFHWVSTTGKRTFRPSPKQMSKALEMTGMTFDDVTESFLYDEKRIKEFIGNLLTVNKQTRDIEHTYKVFKSNMAMKHLSKRQIPRDIMKSLADIYNVKKSIKPNIQLCSQYQKILGAIGTTETGSYFEGFDLANGQNDQRLGDHIPR